MLGTECGVLEKLLLGGDRWHLNAPGACLGGRIPHPVAFGIWKRDQQHLWWGFGFPALCFFSQPWFSCLAPNWSPSGITVFYHDLLPWEFIIIIISFLWWQNLDLTKRKMLHEGPLTWKVNRDKTIGESGPSPRSPGSGWVCWEGEEGKSSAAVPNYASYCHL